MSSGLFPKAPPEYLRKQEEGLLDAESIHESVDWASKNVVDPIWDFVMSPVTWGAKKAWDLIPEEDQRRGSGPPSPYSFGLFGGIQPVSKTAIKELGGLALESSKPIIEKTKKLSEEFPETTKWVGTSLKLADIIGTGRIAKDIVNTMAKNMETEVRGGKVQDYINKWIPDRGSEKGVMKALKNLSKLPQIRKYPEFAATLHRLGTNEDAWRKMLDFYAGSKIGIIPTYLQQGKDALKYSFGNPKWKNLERKLGLSKGKRDLLGSESPEIRRKIPGDFGTATLLNFQEGKGWSGSPLSTHPQFNQWLNTGENLTYYGDKSRVNQYLFTDGIPEQVRKVHSRDIEGVVVPPDKTTHVLIKKPRDTASVGIADLGAEIAGVGSTVGPTTMKVLRNTDNINDIAKVYDVSTKDPRLIMEILQVSKQIDKDFGENLLIKAKKIQDNPDLFPEVNFKVTDKFIKDMGTASAVAQRILKTRANIYKIKKKNPDINDEDLWKEMEKTTKPTKRSKNNIAADKWLYNQWKNEKGKGGGNLRLTDTDGNNIGNDNFDNLKLPDDGFIHWGESYRSTHKELGGHHVTGSIQIETTYPNAVDSLKQRLSQNTALVPAIQNILAPTPRRAKTTIKAMLTGADRHDIGSVPIIKRAGIRPKIERKGIDPIGGDSAVTLTPTQILNNIGEPGRRKHEDLSRPRFEGESDVPLAKAVPEDVADLERLTGVKVKYPDDYSSTKDFSKNRYMSRAIREANFQTPIRDILDVNFNRYIASKGLFTPSEEE